MALFQHCSVLFELKGLPFKEKKKIKLAVTENGGIISYVANKECSLIVTSDVSSLSSNRLRNIVKHQIPVVGLSYVYSCLEAAVRLPVDDFKLDIPCPSIYSPPLWKGKPSASIVTAKLSKSQDKPPDSVTLRVEPPKGRGNVAENNRTYTETDHDLPKYPENFQVAKYSVFEKTNSSSWCVLELQSAKSENVRQYRVVRYWKNDIQSKKAAVRDRLVFLSTSEEALKVYQALTDSMKADGLKQRSHVPPHATELGSAPLQQLLLEEKLNTGGLSQEVGVFVELLWEEAMGCLEHILQVPVDKISLNDVTRAEGLLLQAQRKLNESKYEEGASYWSEFYTLLPHQTPLDLSIHNISQHLDLCQLIRDILNVSEMTSGSSVPSSLGKYRALRCGIEAVPFQSPEFEAVTSLLQHSKIQVHQILRINRGVELQTFKSEIGNIKPLLHSSSPSNFVGILSRGLLLPRAVVEHHGIERTDAGNLGSGIYFSDNLSTALKYSKLCATDDSRLLLVCDVSLGRCKDVHKRDLTLTQAPEEYDSVHGVRKTPYTQSDFVDDEYVVYSPDQVKLKYVVQFSREGEQLKTFTPEIKMSEEPSLPSSDPEVRSDEDDIDKIKNPLEKVTAGLLDSSGQQIPLQMVHVKCKLMDLLSQVIIFQKYTNQSSWPIEAKYVFPLDDSAAVCGFEAFINGKHVVGQVKEKEAARKEYKQAIEKGHGAYLMDQDAPDVFTISVGNLPPGATVLIKVTFVSELIVKDGSIFFSLPGSVAPWQESAALNQTTQVTVEKVCVTEGDNSREFHLDMSIDMPHEITKLECITHQIKTKRTDCKAVVSVLPGEVMGPEGFQLMVTLSEVHTPRMWVEKHPDKDSQACMLVFYPNFEVTSTSTSDEVVLLLDASESMRGESLSTAQRIALHILKTLDRNLRVNVIFFGTDHTEAFLSAQPISEAHQAAKHFIQHFSSAGGSTELWRPLRALSLLPPSSGTRNLLLLSDGHIQNAELTLQLLRDNFEHSRLFTCGLSPTANRHMLRALAAAGGGAYEFFDTKTKHNWSEKVASQVKRLTAPGARSVSVKWQQFNARAPPPVQAPKQLHALFNDCHALVYGFVPHCTQATLLGNLSGQELKTMVSTSELQKTKGTFLHKLTARALIRDFEDGNLDSSEAQHEGKKAELKSFIIELSKEFSILSQFTSFVAIEERESEQEQGFTDIPKEIAEEDVDFLPYIGWASSEEEEDEDFFGLDNRYEDSCEMEDFDLESCVIDEDCYRSRGEFYSSASGSLFGQMMSTDALQEQHHVLRGTSQKMWDQYVPTDLITPPSPRASQDLLRLRTYASSQSLSFDPTPPPLLLGPPVAYTAQNYLPSAPSLIPPPHPVCLSEKDSLSRPLLRECLSFAASPTPPPPSQFPTADSLSTPLLMESLSFAPTVIPPPSPSFYGLRKMLPLSVPVPVQSSSLAPSPTPPPPLCPPAMAPSNNQHLTFQEQSSNEALFRTSSSAASDEQPQHLQRDSMTPSFSFKKKKSRDLHERSAYEVQRRSCSVASDEQPQHLQRDSMTPSLSFERKLSRESFLQNIQRTKFQSRAAVLNKAEIPEETMRRISPKYREIRSRRCALESSSNLVRREVEPTKEKWTKIFNMQHSEGYWELSSELGRLINCDIHRFANDFLKSKGIGSLGVKAHADILKLLATLLVLQLMRLEKIKEGQLLRTLFCLEDCTQLPRPEHWDAVNRAVKWACWADRQYPCMYSRLEFGRSWESSTKQLLGFEDISHLSPLRGLNLNRFSVIIVH